jgi:hypothetical protein
LLELSEVGVPKPNALLMDRVTHSGLSGYSALSDRPYFCLMS